MHSTHCSALACAITFALVVGVAVVATIVATATVHSRDGASMRVTANATRKNCTVARHSESNSHHSGDSRSTCPIICALVLACFVVYTVIMLFSCIMGWSSDDKGGEHDDVVKPRDVLEWGPEVPGFHAFAAYV